MAFAHGASDFYSGMVPLLIFAIVTANKLSPLYQGAIGFLWYLTSSIVQPLFGAYSDRRGRWWFLPASVGVTAAAVSALGAAPNLTCAALLVIVGGLGSAVMHPEAGKYAALLSGARRSGGISIFQIGGAAGYALGPVVIARLLQHGTAQSLWMLAPGIAMTAAMFVMMRGLDAHAERARKAHHASIADAPVDHVGVVLLVAGTALRYLAAAAFVTYLPNLIVSRGGTIAEAGTIVTLFLAVGVAGLYAGGYLGDRFGPVPIAIGSLFASAAALFGFFALPGVFAIASLLIAGALLNVQAAPSVAIVQRMLPRNLGMALGLMNGVAFGAGSALVTAVGFAVSRTGAASALIDVSALPVLAAAAYWIAGRRMGAAGTLAATPQEA